MHIETFNTNTDTDNFVLMAREWFDESQKKEFGLSIDLSKTLLDIGQLAFSPNSIVFLLVDNNKIIGFYGAAISCSKFSNQMIAEERYYYVTQENRGISSLKLIKAATEWAKNKQCSHFIIYASNLASELHDRTCQLYEKLGMKKFETSYVKEL